MLIFWVTGIWNQKLWFGSPCTFQTAQCCHIHYAVNFGHVAYWQMSKNFCMALISQIFKNFTLMKNATLKFIFANLRTYVVMYTSVPRIISRKIFKLETLTWKYKLILCCICIKSTLSRSQGTCFHLQPNKALKAINQITQFCK